MSVHRNVLITLMIKECNRIKMNILSLQLNNVTKLSRDVIRVTCNNTSAQGAHSATQDLNPFAEFKDENSNEIIRNNNDLCQ